MKTLAYHKIASLLLTMLLIFVALVPVANADEFVFNVQFSGVIDVVPENPGDPWQIAGHTVAVDDATQVILTKNTPAAPGMWATVQALRQADDSLLAGRIIVLPPEMRLRGPVQEKPEDDLGTWIIAGQAFLVDEETSIGTRAGAMQEGDWVEVAALEGPAGVLKAVRIHTIEAAEDIQLHGAIQALGATWQISSVLLTSTTDTIVVGEPEVGLLATALATLQPDNTLLAKAVKVNWTEPQRQRPQQPVQLRGTIEALPADGLIGVWVVSGKTVNVTEATRIFQVKGVVAVGAEVHIIGWEENDEITAATITVLQSPLLGGRRFQLKGEIVALPPGGLYGPWTINVDGEQVQILVHLRTRIEGKEHAQVGATVEAGGVQLRDGTRITTWLRIQGRTQNGPGPNVQMPDNS